MFTPKIYQDNDPASIRKFIHENGFGILVSITGGQLWATHIPMVLSEDGNRIIRHMSRANKQWKDLGTQETLAIFSGPHTYISSSWYDHENVPTWNYLAVHVYGSIRVLEDDDLYKALDELADKYEKASEKPVSMSTMSPEYVKREIKGAVGFDIVISRIEATKKISQNRDDKNHSAIVDQLEKRGDHDSKAIAELMKENRCPINKSTHE